MALTVIFYLPSGQDNDINLMKACWNELFALGLAQCSSVMNVGTILSAIINHLQTSLQEGGRAQPLLCLHGGAKINLYCEMDLRL